MDAETTLDNTFCSFIKPITASGIPRSAMLISPQTTPVPSPPIRSQNTIAESGTAVQFKPQPKRPREDVEAEDPPSKRLDTGTSKAANLTNPMPTPNSTLS